MGFLSYLFDALIVFIDNIFYIPNSLLMFLVIPSTLAFMAEAMATTSGLMLSIVSDPLIFPLYLQAAFLLRIVVWFARVVLGYIRFIWSLLPFTG